MGKKLEAGEWEIYLVAGGKTVIARAQAVLDGKYRVDRISAQQISFTFLPLNQAQRLNFGGAE